MPTQNTTAIGKQAEAVVATHLRDNLGHEILAMNYRTRFYEIDIISRKREEKREIIYFTEVKYRKNPAFGNGFEQITPKKLQQMRFAARTFLSDKHLSSQAFLAAASVSGTDFQIDEWFALEE
jgi:Holliday junction resolvase-like predicted endonuclease